MSFDAFVARHLRHPKGFLGEIFASVMNNANHELNQFMKQAMCIGPSDRVLEIGFGSGKLIHEMAHITTNGGVAGIDTSATRVSQVTRHNRKLISSGRVTLVNASVESIPFDDAAFTKVCSANTLDWWPDPEENIREIYRVLTNGGSVALGFSAEKQRGRQPISRHGNTLYSEDSVMALLRHGGFSCIEMLREKRGQMTTYCALATK
ncbi:SAM-dependent methyltransferase [Hahella chejuensis KCTC 2396]|uniref:SAM-dependent methyltransferase n=1 Tax=Hahella chejuensis (strain KCTC 2396) TaxID=349521 RepID=Q2S771_HAHCH|nr:methyltransferase domain-containing protein [Hahella chejuensis]ABC33503.1 SAM-dependent methyltransferase [Hahella chejuensis KCTC 2396]